MRLIPKEYGLKFKVRLLGVRMSHLVKRGGKDAVNGASVQFPGQLDLSLFDDELKTARLIKAFDSVRDKHGEGSILLAGTLRE